MKLKNFTANDLQDLDDQHTQAELAKQARLAKRAMRLEFVKTASGDDLLGAVFPDRKERWGLPEPELLRAGLLAKRYWEDLQDRRPRLRGLKCPPFQKPVGLTDDHAAQAWFWTARANSTDERAGFDSCGHWGLGEHQMRWAWIASGGNRDRYLAISRLSIGAAYSLSWKGVELAHQVRRLNPLSLERFKRFVRHAPENWRISAREASRFGRLPWYMIAWALHSSEGQYSRINWSKAMEIMAWANTQERRARFKGAFVSYDERSLNVGSSCPAFDEVLERLGGEYRVSGFTYISGRSLVSNRLAPIAASVKLVTREINERLPHGLKITQAQLKEALAVEGPPFNEALGAVMAKRVPIEYRMHLCSAQPPVVGWLLHLANQGKADYAFTPITMVGPEGDEVCVAPIERLDLVREEDIHHVSASPRRVFERAAQRLREEYEEAARDNVAPLRQEPLPDEIKLLKGVRVLNTPRDLIIEGREQNHCVGGYAPMVRNGKSVILALKSESGHRSTVELRFDHEDIMSVGQHMGARNSAPHKSCVELLEKVLAK